MSRRVSEYDYLTGKTCPYCQSPLKKNADAIICSSCGTPHHKECWDENKGCTTYGCSLNPTHEDQLDVPEEAIDVGDQTLESIRESLRRQGEDLFIDCPNCSERIEDGSTYCKFCGFNVKENKFDDAETELEKDYKRRYRDKLNITRNRTYLTIASFVILAVSFVILGFMTVKKLNDYFASDKYLIRSTIDSWVEARKEKDIDKMKTYMTNDYEYIGKDGKKQDMKERVRRLEQIYKNAGEVTLGISDFTMVNDTTVTPNDREVTYFENFKAGKVSERGMKTVRLYKGEKTNEEWKIYLEIVNN